MFKKFNGYLLFFAIAIAGCGGSSKEKPLGTAPILTVSQAITVDERTNVELTVTAQNSNDIKSYQWKQSSGPAVDLLSADTQTASFNAPSLLLSEGVKELLFEVKVTNNSNQTSTANVQVTVQPISQVPTFTVPTEIKNASGAFTMLNWQIIQSEPISKVTLTSNDLQEYNIELIDDTSALFNVPKAVNQNVETTFTLTLTDEDNNSSSEIITVVGEVVSPKFSQPRLVYEQEENIYDIVDYTGVLSVTSFSSPLAMKYLDGNLKADTDFSLPKSISGADRFIDFNHDGFVDALVVTEKATADYSRCDTFERVFDVTLLLGSANGFIESQTIHTFECISVWPEDLDSSHKPLEKSAQRSTGFLSLKAKDINDDGYADLFFAGNWYLYSPLTTTYELADKFRGIWQFWWFHEYHFINAILDINSDGNTDIIRAVDLQEHPDLIYTPSFRLEWSKKIEADNFANYELLENELGIYEDLFLADVNLDGKNDLVLTYKTPSFIDDLSTVSGMRWYSFEDTINRRKSFDYISHFIDIYGEGTPYFFDFNKEEGTLIHYEYNELVERPTIKEVQQLLPGDFEYQGYIFHDIENDGDLDVVAWQDNKVYLIENVKKE
ncbi:PKD domain-containing protein [Thalassotalea fusca]